MLNISYLNFIRWFSPVRLISYIHHTSLALGIRLSFMQVDVAYITSHMADFTLLIFLGKMGLNDLCFSMERNCREMKINKQKGRVYRNLNKSLGNTKILVQIYYKSVHSITVIERPFAAHLANWQIWVSPVSFPRSFLPFWQWMVSTVIR